MDPHPLPNLSLLNLHDVPTSVNNVNIIGDGRLQYLTEVQNKLALYKHLKEIKKSKKEAKRNTSPEQRDSGDRGGKHRRLFKSYHFYVDDRRVDMKRIQNISDTPVRFEEKYDKKYRRRFAAVPDDDDEGCDIDEQEQSNDEEQKMLDRQEKSLLVLWKPPGQEVTREDQAETETTKKTRQTATFESTFQLLLKIRNTLQKQKLQLAKYINQEEEWSNKYGDTNKWSRACYQKVTTQIANTKRYIIVNEEREAKYEQKLTMFKDFADGEVDDTSDAAQLAKEALDAARLAKEALDLSQLAAPAPQSSDMNDDGEAIMKELANTVVEATSDLSNAEEHFKTATKAAKEAAQAAKKADEDEQRAAKGFAEQNLGFAHDAAQAAIHDAAQAARVAASVARVVISLDSDDEDATVKRENTSQVSESEKQKSDLMNKQFEAMNAHLVVLKAHIATMKTTEGGTNEKFYDNLLATVNIVKFNIDSHQELLKMNGTLQ